jgi:hypothetical protein
MSRKRKREDNKIETELHRQVKQALADLLIPDLQDIVTQYIPIVKLESYQGLLSAIVSNSGPVVALSGNSRRYLDTGRGVWYDGKQTVSVSRQVLHPDVNFFGHPDNPVFECTLDFSGIVFDPAKCHTIEIDPDLDKVLRVTEY